MAAGLRKKFDQNPVMKDKLIKLEGFIYEATRTDYWGAGFVLAQAATVKNDEIKGDNVLGEELVKLQDQYLSEIAGNDV